MLIAGEPSGDLHASHLISALKQECENADFVFLGGDLMENASGKKAAVHIREMAFMGFSEVLRNINKINDNLKTAKHLLDTVKPDALILIDYPSFNLKIARHAKRLGIPVFYYISPKVWAWKEHRVKAIKRLVDQMYVIFPFEVEFYKLRHDYDVTFVGNPSVAEVEGILKEAPSHSEFLKRNGLRDRPIIALLPGSRLGEIRNNLPVMVKTVERFPQYRGVIAGAPGVNEDFYKGFSDLPVIYNQTIELLSYSCAALVTSGTATLETALTKTPQVACYRSNGSKLAYNIMAKLLKVPYVTLPNLIVNRQIIPEMLLHECTADKVADELTPLLRETPSRKLMTEGYEELRDILVTPGIAPINAARDIVARLKIKNN